MIVTAAISPASDPHRSDSTEPVEATPAAAATPPGRRRRWVLLGAAVVVVAAAVAAAVVLLDGDDATTDAVAATPRRAVLAETTDLVEFVELDGTLTYPQISSLTAATDGTVTAVADDGTRLVRGDVAYEINAEPVTVVYGDVPAYRVLAEGDEGDDVLQFEAHLASLGYHAELDDDDNEMDGGFVVDGVFDAATTDAVIRWQSDLGLPDTGVVALNHLIVVPGPAVISDVGVDPGDRVQPGAPVAQLNVAEEIDSFHSAHSGEIELVAASGTTLTSGQVLYTVDDEPVLAVVTDDDIVFDRDLALGVADGDDVRLVEEMLVAAGFDADGALDVDEEFDEVTEEALAELWEALDGTYESVVVDGSIDADQLVVVPTAATIGSVTEHEADVLATGAELFTWSSGSQGRLVTTAIAVDEQDHLAEGDSVDVRLPDGTVVVGEVVAVAVSSQTDPTDPTADPVLPVEISLAAVPDEIAALNEIEVEVLIVDQLVSDATTVPVSALVATGGGDYAVEVVEPDGISTTFVAVEPGMFADGAVEVTGIEPGTAVVVP